MTISHLVRKTAPRLLLFALLTNAVFAITAGKVISGDGGGSPPFPVPNGPKIPPPDSTGDTIKPVM